MLVLYSSSKLPIPLPKHTPVFSFSSGDFGFHPASWNAISVAAIAYCVNLANRRSSPLSSQSEACHLPSSRLPTGTMPATWLGSSRHRDEGSRFEVLTMPHSLARSRLQVRRIPTPRGVMAPRPVTTTRRIVWPCQLSTRACCPIQVQELQVKFVP